MIVLIGAALVGMSIVFLALSSTDTMEGSRHSKAKPRTGILKPSPLDSEEPREQGWTQIHPTPESLLVRDVTAIDSRTAWVSGDDGVIMKTTDGSTWKKQESPTRECLNSISAFDADRVWAAGEAGVVLNTTDGGRTWGSLFFDLGDITEVSAVDRSTVWMLSPYQDSRNSGLIIKTEDAGKTWRYFASDWAETVNDQRPARLEEMCAVDSAICWAVAYRQIERSSSDSTGSAWYDKAVLLRTTDGGLSWNDVTPEDMGSIHCYCAPGKNKFMLYFSTSSGVLKCVKTEDGGKSWSTVEWLPNNTVAMGSRGKDDLWLCADGGVMLTRDGGKNWVKVSDLPRRDSGFSNSDETQVSIAATDGNTVWIADGDLYKTEDAGQKWVCQVSQSQRIGAFTAVSVPDLNTAWVCGDDGLLLSTDSGTTWMTLRPAGKADRTFLEVSAINREEAWAGLRPLTRTLDGGETWFGVDSPMFATRGFDAVDAQIAWGVVDSSENAPMVARTINGGNTWLCKQLPLASGVRLTVSAVDGQTAWLAAADNTVWRTIDGGGNWSVVTCPKPDAEDRSPLWASAVDSNVVAVVSDDLDVMEITDNGGASWTAMKSPVAAGISVNGIFPRRLAGVEMIDRNTVWILANGSISARLPTAWFLFRTQDRGRTWKIELFERKKSIRGFDATPWAVWVVGDKGLLMRKEL